METFNKICFWLIVSAFMGITSCEENDISPNYEPLGIQQVNKNASSGTLVFKNRQQIDLREGYVEYNACTGEVISIVEGVWRIESTVIINKKKLTIQSHSNTSRYKLLDTSTGVEYVGSYVSNDVFNYNIINGYPFEETYSLKILLTTSGKGNNAILRAKFHITVDATGKLTSYVDDFRAECQ